MRKEQEDAKRYILIKGARVHNLKNINVSIPKNKFTVVTGVSGSGKSSLAFDTLYAEGQRRYVESLSAYARQFMGKVDKPDVDYIKGIAPAIAIEQKIITNNPRSTVGTSTEVYDYLKLLYARIGKTISPITGKEVKKDTVTSVVTFISALPVGSMVAILCPLHPHPQRSLEEELAILLQKGFLRVLVNEQFVKVEDFLQDTDFVKGPYLDASKLKIVIDRVVVSQEEETWSRLADSVQTAFFEGKGDCFIQVDQQIHAFCDRFEQDGIRFEEPSANFFSFNNSYGACKCCGGQGTVVGIQEHLVIPDEEKSILDGAIAPWRTPKMRVWFDTLVKEAKKLNFPLDAPYSQLSEQEKALLWTGNKHFQGLNDFFKYLETQTFKIQYSVMLSRYRAKAICPECRGSRLRKDANYVKVGGQSITDIVLMPIDKALEFFENIQLNSTDRTIAERLLLEIANRLRTLKEVGLGYLTLNRLSSTLSGGESQRIRLATSLGSTLVGSIYVLDEPSIGLHPRDTQRLIHVLLSLRDIGNTVLVVEHEEEMMRAADNLLDIGPQAGLYGGNVVFAGTFQEILKSKESLTGKYLSGKASIAIPMLRRQWEASIQIEGAKENNLKNICVAFPLNAFVCVTGVSGSGKTSLVKKVLEPALKNMVFSTQVEKPGLFKALNGACHLIKNVEMVDQNPIGRSSRSNPVTYIKAWDEIRNLLAMQPSAKASRLSAADFSFNAGKGRCDTCLGEGEVIVEMQFMADIHLPCEACGGKRFKQTVLEVRYKERNAYDILQLTVEEALSFFELEPKVLSKLQVLANVGLGYVHLGQSSNTLSGGEAQRIKLASFLAKGNNLQKTMFIFDEPTTGLHLDDIKKLLVSFEALLAQGHSLVVIEHNMDVIKCADWVIDMGPEGGEGGGYVVFAGTPEDLIKCENSHTARFLKDKLRKAAN